MKAFSIAVAVTLVLAFFCAMESSAVPFAGVQEQEPEEAGSDDTPVEAHQGGETSDWWMMPIHMRKKRNSHLSLCVWCCKCCKNQKGCGVCCKF